jgi:hypothetical protein
MGRPLRCRFGIHKWQVHTEPDVDPYFECARCGRMQEVDRGPIEMGGGIL